MQDLGLPGLGNTLSHRAESHCERHHVVCCERQLRVKKGCLWLSWRNSGRFRWKGSLTGLQGIVTGLAVPWGRTLPLRLSPVLERLAVEVTLRTQPHKGCAGWKGERAPCGRPIRGAIHQWSSFVTSSPTDTLPLIHDIFSPCHCHLPLSEP